MNRVSWDSTAPRRLGRKRGKGRRPDDLVIGHGEVVWPPATWPLRVGPFC